MARASQLKKEMNCESIAQSEAHGQSKFIKINGIPKVLWCHKFKFPSILYLRVTVTKPHCSICSYM